MTTGGQILIESLAAHEVRRIFCVAGESYLPALDALLDYPEIDVITCRQESGVTFMAEAHANLSGVPGIAFVTRGPGACNASIGIHTGKQSSTPMIMFVGLVSRTDEGKEAFQEFDLPQMFGSHTKWAAVINDPAQIAEMTAKAFEVAQSGRPGPVVLGLPEDILSEVVSGDMPAPHQILKTAPREGDFKAVQEILQAAQKPLVLVGGGLWSDVDCGAFERFAEKSNLPVMTSFRRQDVFDHKHKNYIGELGTGPNPALVARVKESDVVLILGPRLSEITTQGYTLFEGQKLIHIYPDAGVFGKAYQPDLGVECDVSLFISALDQIDLDGAAWTPWLESARQDYEAWTAITEEVRDWDGADVTQIFRQLREVLPDDAIITTDAGNFSGWCQRYLRYGRPGRLLAPISGAMGYAVPSAVAASIECPDKTVLGICGDGGFMMTAQESATAIHHNAKPIIMIFNNNMYGTIRMHQQRDFPGRISGTALTNPDFIKFAESYGAFAARIDHADQFADVWAAARASGKLAVIEVRQDPRQITTQSRPD